MIPLRRPFPTLWLVVLLAGCSWPRPRQAFDVVSGMISHNLCSEVFVTGVEPSTAYARSLAPRGGMSLVNWAVHYEVDGERREVRTEIAGHFASRAVYREGLGCFLIRGGATAEVAPLAGPSVDASDAFPSLARAEVVHGMDPRLRAAVATAFEERSQAPFRWTRAVVVVRDGELLAERYAPGFGIDTPLLGYSVSKSVLNALLGILVRDQRLRVDAPAPIAAWSGSDDPRRAITVDHLLRMTSGLALTESGSPFSPVGRMLYVEPDMAAYAARAELEKSPGSRWSYTSGNTLLLSGIVRDAVGGDAQGVVDFLWRELFGPLGMRTATFELDARGTPLGSTYMLASARDWARFGMLYLRDGVLGQRRILPEGWVRNSTTPTLDTGYGAGFWTNQVDATIPWTSIPWGVPGIPRDAYFARGLLGQYIVIVPSQRLVVVRFGTSHDALQDIDGVGRMIADVIAALGEADEKTHEAPMAPR